MRYNHKKIYIGIIVIVLIVIACIVFGSKVTTQQAGTDLPVVLPPRNDLASQVPMVAVFKNKIVYTADMSAPKADYVADCEVRGGTFDACGSPCAPDAQICAMHCAYTCTLPLTK